MGFSRVDTAAGTLPPKEVSSMWQSNFSPTGRVWGQHCARGGLGNPGGTISAFFFVGGLFGDDINPQDYRHLVSSMSRRASPDCPRFPCVTPSWDNSARRSRGAYLFIESSPKLFHQWPVAALAKLMKSKNTPHILFLNSWNEWAEGNHLEPDQLYGRSYLEALREALQSVDS